MFAQDGSVRAHYEALYQQLQKLGLEELASRAQEIHRQMILEGITFQLSSADHRVERTIPFDVIPRIIPKNDWTTIEAGLKQRVQALNLFLHDMYHDQHFIKDGIIPRRAIINNPYFVPDMMQLDIPENTYIAISGIDLIRDEKGNYYVLEDNLRTPSGLSYIFKNRMLMMHHFPDLYFSYHIAGLDPGMQDLLTTLQALAPSHQKNPVVVLLTPGRYNSAYFEHVFLAQQMGIELVEGADLRVINQKVYLNSIDGLKQVDVIYRRIDDSFLDPLAFNPNSLVGIPGLINAYRAGNVALANAPGTGIADDKFIYTKVPDMIRYYLHEEPILKNVPTYSLANPTDYAYVLDHLAEMVVKQTTLSGGYGMLIGPQESTDTIAAFRDKIIKNPQWYIAQPVIQLSQSPVLCGTSLEHRYIDLRPFIFSAKKQTVLPGGLTRVAMRRGSLVVNSSQGGGSKDTWIV